MIPMSIAIGPLPRLMTRSMHVVLASRQSWCQLLPLTVAAQNENFLLARPNRQLSAKEYGTAVRVVYADASYGVEHGCHIAHGPWTVEEAAQSSTW